MSRKSQAALEFLTTYAWAFLVIMITVGALYYFGIFDFSKFLPQRCLFPSQFECLDFSFTGNQIKAKLVNNLGEMINVNSITITNDAAAPLDCDNLGETGWSTWNPGWNPNWVAGTEKDLVFGNCKNGVFIVGQRAEAKITMKYCAPATTGCPEHTVNGKITAMVS